MAHEAWERNIKDFCTDPSTTVSDSNLLIEGREIDE